MEVFDAIWEWIGVLAIAGALFVGAYMLHGASGSKFWKFLAVVLSGATGMALVVTPAIDLGRGISGGMPGIAGVALFVVVVIIVVDWVRGRQLDKPAFFAVLLLPMLIVLGWGELGMLWDQVGAGASQVGDQLPQGG